MTCLDSRQTGKARTSSRKRSKQYAVGLLSDRDKHKSYGSATVPSWLQLLSLFVNGEVEQRAVQMKHKQPSHVPAYERTTLRRIFSYVMPYHWRAAGVLVCIVLASVLSLALPWFAKRIVDVAIPQRDLTLLWLYCTGMVAGPVAAGLLQVAQKYGSETIGQSVMFDLRVALYQRLHEMPFSFFAKQSPGESISRVLNDAQGAGASSATRSPISRRTALCWRRRSASCSYWIGASR